MACKLQPTPLGHFEARSGEKARLILKDVIGDAQITSAAYDGDVLSVDGKSVDFIVDHGSNSLSLLLAFSDSSEGRCELHEDCGAGASNLLLSIDAHSPAVLLEIVGTDSTGPK